METKEFDMEGLNRYIETEWKPVRKGFRWRCIRCSWCCKQPWIVNMTWIEHDRIVLERKGLPTPVFKKVVDPSTGLDHPFFTIKGCCPMFREKGAVCTLYPDWPYTCATYPFLLMPDGALLYHEGCAGNGIGDVMDIDAMKRKILSERKKAGMVTGP